MGPPNIMDSIVHENIAHEERHSGEHTESSIVHQLHTYVLCVLLVKCKKSPTNTQKIPIALLIFKKAAQSRALQCVVCVARVLCVLLVVRVCVARHESVMCVLLVYCVLCSCIVCVARHYSVLCVLLVYCVCCS